MRCGLDAIPAILRSFLINPPQVHVDAACPNDLATIALLSTPPHLKNDSLLEPSSFKISKLSGQPFMSCFGVFQPESSLNNTRITTPDMLDFYLASAGKVEVASRKWQPAWVGSSVPGAKITSLRGFRPRGLFLWWHRNPPAKSTLSFPGLFLR